MERRDRVRTPTTSSTSLAACVHVAAERDRFWGAALVARGDRVLLSAAHGLANAEWGVPNAPDTRFRIASLTKAFTAACVLVLQQDRRLSVRDPLSAHVEGCPAAWRDVTLHHLLTHSSGIVDASKLPRPREARRVPTTPAAAVAPAMARPLEFAPGSRYRYCNTGYVLLGMVIERVSGGPYDASLARHVLAPLGLRDTGYDHHRALLPRRAAGYERWAVQGGPDRPDGDGGDETLENADFVDSSHPYAAGALYSAVGDLHRWSRALSTDGLLTPESRASMFAPHVAIDAAAAYGYGWRIGRGALGRPVQRHAGGFAGFTSWLVRYPEDDLLVVVLSNVADSPVGPLAGRLASVALKG